jgi:hypothetical protein
VLQLVRLVAARAATVTDGTGGPIDAATRAGSSSVGPSLADVDMESSPAPALAAPPPAAARPAPPEDDGEVGGPVSSMASAGSSGGAGVTVLPSSLVRSAAGVGVLLFVKIVARRDSSGLANRCAAVLGDVMDASPEGSLALLRQSVVPEVLPSCSHLLQPPAGTAASWVAKLVLQHPAADARASFADILLRAARRALGCAGAAPGGGAVDSLAETLLELGAEAAAQWATNNTAPREEVGQLDAYLRLLAELARAGGLSQEQADRLVTTWVEEARAGADTRPALVRRIAQVEPMCFYRSNLWGDDQTLP